MTLVELPEAKQQAIRREFPRIAEGWIKDYPALVARCIDKWQLTLGELIRVGLPINILIYATGKNDEQTVIKIAPPHPEQLNERIALDHLNADMMVNLIDYSVDDGAILLERILPGRMLREVILDRDEVRRATSLLASVPVEIEPTNSDTGWYKQLPRYQGWMDDAFEKYRSETPTSDFVYYLKIAEVMFETIQRECKGDFLLHGDLHHENILFDASRGWVAIDPKGVIGPKLMECGRFLHNFMEDELDSIENLSDAEIVDLVSILSKRYALASEVLNVSIGELAKATFVDITLSACWSFNAGASEYVKKMAMQRVEATYHFLRSTHQFSSMS
ncbi:MAG: aminoglycoside phosphotransferase family protein [Pseudomonadales bacterium]|nr:aminoglycoside phosphotransferase family protein [Pseudomonadales bacterium]MDG1442095.1 aminoglycoside phosphotransferase family protein [Pseudomonadales bacterium]